ncbi:MAG: YHS domain-containing protein [Acidimicrobiia bacterium]
METDTHDVDGDAAALVTDPVCGMRIDPSQASATVTRDGDTYSFCSNSCHGQFVAGYAFEPTQHDNRSHH